MIRMNGRVSLGRAGGIVDAKIVQTGIKPFEGMEFDVGFADVGGHKLEVFRASGSQNIWKTSPAELARFNASKASKASPVPPTAIGKVARFTEEPGLNPDVVREEKPTVKTTTLASEAGSQTTRLLALVWAASKAGEKLGHSQDLGDVLRIMNTAGDDVVIPTDYLRRWKAAGSPLVASPPAPPEEEPTLNEVGPELQPEPEPEPQPEPEPEPQPTASEASPPAEPAAPAQPASKAERRKARRMADHNAKTCTCKSHPIGCPAVREYGAKRHPLAKKS